jgi:hypothetical protein
VAHDLNITPDIDFILGHQAGDSREAGKETKLLEN